MNVYNNFIPGTTLDLEKSGGATGAEFLDKIFYISDGIMLSYIREISGIDGTTLQNWVKRGWVLNPVNKLYSKEQVARILIINMVRETMQLSKITYLLNYINGEVSDKSDDIIYAALLKKRRITSVSLKQLYPKLPPTTETALKAQEKG